MKIFHNIKLSWNYWPSAKQVQVIYLVKECQQQVQNNLCDTKCTHPSQEERDCSAGVGGGRVKDKHLCLMCGSKNIALSLQITPNKVVMNNCYCSAPAYSMSLDERKGSYEHKTPTNSESALVISTQVRDCFQSSGIVYELGGAVASEIELGRTSHSAFSTHARSSEHTSHECSTESNECFHRIMAGKYRRP